MLQLREEEKKIKLRVIFEAIKLKKIFHIKRNIQLHVGEEKKRKINILNDI